jgi:hypothetical protein
MAPTSHAASHAVRSLELEASIASQWQELHGSCFYGKGSWTRSPPTSAHPSWPTYGELAQAAYDVRVQLRRRELADAGSCSYTQAGPLTASILHIPPSGALHRHPVPLRDMRSGTSGAVAGVIQVS